MVTPLAIGGPTDSALPVVRGWVADPDRRPDAAGGRAQLVGWLQPPEGTGAVDDDPTDDVLPELRIADLLQHVDQDLYGGYAVGQRARRRRAAGRRPRRSCRTPGRSTALRNLLYAIEWWVFGAFAIFIWWRWLREELRSAPRAAPDDPDQPGT